MSSHIPDDLRQSIINRAQNRCEYCGLSQRGQAAAFHIDHIFPVSAGGQTNLENLALACVGCSLHKAARITGPDPLTGELVPIYHPRQNDWLEHFRWDGVRVFGITQIGRATVATLKMNRPIMFSIREEEQLFGRHPHLQ
jgi:hypothetical protein